MRTIGRHHRLAETHYPASQFQRHKMHANDHYAAILRLRTGKVVQPVHIKPFANPAIRPEPGHARFKQRHAKRVEILGDQFFPFFPGEGWKTEFNIFWAIDSRRFRKGRASLPVRVPRKRKTG